jgi:colanic acid/amylovoran biosynthesis protein
MIIKEKFDKPIANEKSYHVCLIGASLATYNMGVSALAASLVSIIQHIRPDADISFLIGNRSSSDQVLRKPDGTNILIKVVNYRLSPKARIYEHLFWIFLMACIQRVIPIKTMRKLIINKTPFLKAIWQADFIGDIRGGDSFSEIYGLRRLIIGSMPAICTLLLRKKLVLLPQTYGPYHSMIGKKLSKYIIERSAYILSRDIQSRNIVKSMTNNNVLQKNIFFCPDVAFMLEPVKAFKPKIKPPLTDETNLSLIGFNVNGLMYNGGFTKKNMFGLKLDYREFARKLAISLLENSSDHILFVPHTYNPPIESDPDACRDVMNSIGQYSERIHIVDGKYDQSEIKGVISSCDFFIGSRMHACIAALSQGIPTIGVAYSRKFQGVFESIGVGDMVIDGRSMNTNEAVYQVFHCFRNRMETKTTLQKNVVAAKVEIMDNFRRVLSI